MNGAETHQQVNKSIVHKEINDQNIVAVTEAAINNCFNYHYFITKQSVICWVYELWYSCEEAQGNMLSCLFTLTNGPGYEDVQLTLMWNWQKEKFETTFGFFLNKWLQLTGLNQSNIKCAHFNISHSIIHRLQIFPPRALADNHL